MRLAFSLGSRESAAPEKAFISLRDAWLANVSLIFWLSGLALFFFTETNVQFIDDYLFLPGLAIIIFYVLINIGMIFSSLPQFLHIAGKFLKKGEKIFVDYQTGLNKMQLSLSTGKGEGK
ncbi:MAG: hypothetical protein V1494_01580 [Candidatus Diapherotrites archaeon]